MRSPQTPCNAHDIAGDACHRYPDKTQGLDWQRQQVLGNPTRLWELQHLTCSLGLVRAVALDRARAMPLFLISKLQWLPVKFADSEGMLHEHATHAAVAAAAAAAAAAVAFLSRFLALHAKNRFVSKIRPPTAIAIMLSSYLSLLFYSSLLSFPRFLRRRLGSFDFFFFFNVFHCLLSSSLPLGLPTSFLCIILLRAFSCFLWQRSGAIWTERIWLSPLCQADHSVSVKEHTRTVRVNIIAARLVNLDEFPTLSRQLHGLLAWFQLPWIAIDICEHML